MRMRNSAWVPPVQYTLRTETRVVEVGVVVRDSRSHSAGGLTRDDFEIEDGGKKREITAFSTETSSPPAAASSARAPSVLARFTNTTDHSPAVTINKFGKGNAIYLATESKASAIGPVLNSIYRMVGIQSGPRTPDGVYARVADGRTLYVNTTEREQRIPIEGRRKGLISGREYDGTLILGPQDADLIP